MNEKHKIVQFENREYFIVMELVRSLFFALGIYWSFLAELASVIGLIVAIWTLRRAGSIKRTLEKSYNKHLLVVRSSDYIKELHKIAKEIISGLIDSQKYDQTTHINLLSKSRSICRSIKEKMEISKNDELPHLVSLDVLDSFLEKASKNVPTKNTEENVQEFLMYVTDLSNELDQMQKDRKEGLK
jgi:hypothetical protein